MYLHRYASLSGMHDSRHAQYPHKISVTLNVGHYVHEKHILIGYCGSGLKLCIVVLQELQCVGSISIITSPSFIAPVIEKYSLRLYVVVLQELFTTVIIIFVCVH